MSTSSPKARSFKTKAFARLARKVGISDDALCIAIAQVQKGQADDLGGGVWKKRLDANRERSIIVAKGGRYWVYTYLFGKQDRNNIDEAELAAFRKLATQFAGVSDDTLSKLLKKKLWVEICHAE